MLRANYLIKTASAIIVLTRFVLPAQLVAQAPAPLPASVILSDGTSVKLRLDQTVSSLHAHVGDPLKFVVVKDVAVDGHVVIPEGSFASGSIVGVKGKRFLGVGGNIVFTLDSVSLADGERVELSARKEVKGSSRTRLMAAGMIAAGVIFWPAAPVFLLSRGCDSTALKGTEVIGHIKGDISVASASLPSVRDDLSQMSDAINFVPPRVLNGEGREGDMVNLMFVAQEPELQRAFQRAGWIKVDRWRPVMAWHLLRHRTHDSKLPMATFYMFGRSQDYSYALPDPAAIVSRRHHLRIWKTDYTVDGDPIWAGAATHDVAIEMWKNGHIINHRIDPEVDAERDFIGENLAATQLVNRQKYLQGIDPVFQAETASGETYFSDSRILLLDLHKIQSSKIEAPAGAFLFRSLPPVVPPIQAAPAAFVSAR